MSQESRLEMVTRHVREGQRHIDRQVKIIEEARAAGMCARASEDLLRTFEATQMLHREHLDRLRRTPS